MPRLDVPVDHPVWCAGDHEPPIRVSGIQSGSFSGPVGSTRGQQRFREGQVVREEQPRLEGWLPASGHVEIRCRMTLSPRSMGALWLAGFEDDEEQLQLRRAVRRRDLRQVRARRARARSAWASRRSATPALTQDFDAPRLPIDPADFHTYAVDWDAEEAVFSVDGEAVRRCPRPPTYPMQAMIAVYDFPEWSVGGDDHLVPELVVDHVAG